MGHDPRWTEASAQSFRVVPDRPRIQTSVTSTDMTAMGQAADGMTNNISRNALDMEECVRPNADLDPVL